VVRFHSHHYANDILYTAQQGVHSLVVGRERLENSYLQRAKRQSLSVAAGSNPMPGGGGMGGIGGMDF